MLHERFAIGGAQAGNRLWLAPMTNLQSHPDGALSDDELRWLTRRARGGFGVVGRPARRTCRSTARGGPASSAVYDDKLLPGLRRLATALREAGTLGLAQIFHGGARAPRAVTGRVPWSATPLELPGGEARSARGTDRRGGRRRRPVRRGRCARRGRRVRRRRAARYQLHGYLLCQFLSAMNTRTDGWGGSFEEARPPDPRGDASRCGPRP